jgi:hypothetical protein
MNFRAKLLLYLLVLPGHVCANSAEDNPAPDFEIKEKHSVQKGYPWEIMRVRYPGDATDTVALRVPWAEGTLVAYRGDDKKLFLERMLGLFIQFNLEFPGGTYREFQKTVGRQISDGFQSQLPEFARDLLPAKVQFHENDRSDVAILPRIGEVRLRQTTWFVMFAEHFKFHTEYRSGDNPRPFDNDFVDVRVEQDAVHFSFALPSKPDLHSSFFNLVETPNKASKQSATDLTALFEIAWAAEHPFIWAQCKYHPETGILLLRGTYDEGLAAQSAFDALCRKSRTENPFEVLNNALKEVNNTLNQQTDLLKAIRNK